MDIGPSLIKPELTAQDLDLILDLGEHAEVVGENETRTSLLSSSAVSR